LPGELTFSRLSFEFDLCDWGVLVFRAGVNIHDFQPNGLNNLRRLEIETVEIHHVAKCEGETRSGIGGHLHRFDSAVFMEDVPILPVTAKNSERAEPDGNAKVYANPLPHGPRVAARDPGRVQLSVDHIVRFVADDALAIGFLRAQHA